MGGRLDATNVANLSPSVCAITPISLDHQDFLGNTVELIAGEKAEYCDQTCRLSSQNSLRPH